LRPPRARARWSLTGASAPAARRGPRAARRFHLARADRRDSQLGQLPNMLPHPLDERVDVCYGETAEHIAMRQQLREQLRKEGIFKNWLENNHVRGARARACGAPRVPVRACAQSLRVRACVCVRARVRAFGREGVGLTF
jgi:hypothetical protein